MNADKEAHQVEPSEPDDETVPWQTEGHAGTSALSSVSVFNISGCSALRPRSAKARQLE